MGSGSSDRIYVLELVADRVLESRRRAGALGYLYVGKTANSVEARRRQHAGGVGSAGRCFRELVAKLGRPLTDEELFSRDDLVTVTPTGTSVPQVERAERRQANKLENEGYVILSRHTHSLRSVRRRVRDSTPMPAAAPVDQTLWHRHSAKEFTVLVGLGPNAAIVNRAITGEEWLGSLFSAARLPILGSDIDAFVFQVADSFNIVMPAEARTHAVGLLEQFVREDAESDSRTQYMLGDATVDCAPEAWPPPAWRPVQPYSIIGSEASEVIDRVVNQLRPAPSSESAKGVFAFGELDRDETHGGGFVAQLGPAEFLIVHWPAPGDPAAKLELEGLLNVAGAREASATELVVAGSTVLAG